MIILSIICAIVTDNMGKVSSAILGGATDAIQLLISMAGMMSLWTGLMKIAELGGLTAILAKFFKPILKRLFPDYPEDSPAIKAICMNITANLLGLGNAATPMGIKAMKEMNKLNKDKSVANNSMIMFIIFNTSSIQLIPTMMSVLRQKHGSISPFDVIPAILLTSLCSLIIGIIATKISEK